MRKHFKKIAAAIMAVVMLMSISTVAMAAEQVPEVSETEETVLRDDVASANKEELVTNNLYYANSVELYKGKELTKELKISAGCDKVQYKVEGVSSGTKGKGVVIQFTNNSTGETKSFTAVAGEGYKVVTYVSGFTGGTYTLSVVYVGKNGNYEVEIHCYP